VEGSLVCFVRGRCFARPALWVHNH
jgi:hypothetical protein